MNHVNFTGASGFTKAYPGMPWLGNYARGDREEGHFYTFWNFQPQLFDKATAVEANGGFAYTGFWYLAMGEGTVTLCGDDEDGYQDYYGPSLSGAGSMTTHKCREIVYNTFDGKPAPDTPPVIKIYIPAAASAFLIAWAALTVLVTLGCVVLTYDYGFTKLIKASQAEMMYVLFLGGFLAGGRVLAAGMALSNSSCLSLIWLGHLCFWLCFASLSIKAYRVHCIVNNSGFKRVKFSIRDTLSILGAVMSAVIIYLIIETVVGEVHMSAFSSTVANQTTDLLVCTFKYAQFNTTLYVLEGLCLVFSARMTWAVKDAPDSVNESKYMALAMGVICLLIVLVMPVVYLLDLIPWQKEVIASVFFGMGAMAVQIIIVAPKAAILLKGMDIGGVDGKLVEQVRPLKYAQIIHLPAASSRQKAKEEHALKKAIKVHEREEAQELQVAGLHIKGTYEDKVRIAREQIVKWRVFLFSLEQADDSGGSGSASGSFSSTGNGGSLIRQSSGRLSTAEDSSVDEPVSASFNRKPHRRNSKGSLLDPVTEELLVTAALTELKMMTTSTTTKTADAPFEP